MYKKIVYWLLLISIIIAGLFFWQLPLILQKMPSRYVARLPEPIQQISRRNIVPLLPTAAVSHAWPDKTLPPAAVSTVPSATATTATPMPASIDEAVSSPTPAQTPTQTATPAPTSTPLPPTIRLEGITHQFQTWNNCGPATLAMTLSYFNIHLGQWATGQFLKPDIEDRNVSPDEMAAFVNEETAVMAIDRANGDLALLREFLANDIPVIVELGIDPPGEYAWMEWYGHYLLVVAYDEASEEFFVYDSWLGTGVEPGDTSSRVGRRWDYAELDHYWQQFNRNYIAVYQPEQAAVAETIIGTDMDDAIMWQNALQQAQIELDAQPDNAFRWFNLGTAHTALEHYEAAAAAFDHARSIGLPRRMLWYQFGPYEAYYQIGRYEDVIVLADVALDKPYIEEVLYYRGLAHAALDHKAAARQDLEAASAFNPRFTPAVAALAQLNSD